MIGRFFKQVFGIGRSDAPKIRIDPTAAGMRQEPKPVVHIQMDHPFYGERRKHNRRIGAIAFESRRRNRG